jgi:hypothetical protein
MVPCSVSHVLPIHGQLEHLAKIRFQGVDHDKTAVFGC